MRELIVAEFITLDGVIQAPGGAEEDTEGGFQHGGWTVPYWHDDIGAHFFQVLTQADAFLLGRKTWQTHGGAFEPMAAGDPFFDAINGISKYVVSTTLKSASAWRNSTLISSNVVETVRELKLQPGKNIASSGFNQAAQQESDLPREAGNPARRALVQAGYGRLELLTGLSEGEIKQLHGVGPKAIAVLRASLAARGLSFAAETRSQPGGDLR